MNPNVFRSCSKLDGDAPMAATAIVFFETTKLPGDFAMFHRAILQCFIGRFCNVSSGDFAMLFFPVEESAIEE